MLNKTEKQDALYRAARSAMGKIKGEELFQYDQNRQVDYKATVIMMQSVAEVTLDLMSEVDSGGKERNRNGRR